MVGGVDVDEAVEAGSRIAGRMGNGGTFGRAVRRLAKEVADGPKQECWVTVKRPKRRPAGPHTYAHFSLRSLAVHHARNSPLQRVSPLFGRMAGGRYAQSRLPLQASPSHGVRSCFRL